MVELYGNMISMLSNVLYTYVLIILLVGGGIYFSIRTKFVQFRYMAESIRTILEPSENKEAISPFKALMVSTASRVGTGNITGISTAICLGGYGAVFWMWMTALLGCATAFVEGTLAQIYKQRAEDGSCYGGPSYYIQNALKIKWLGMLFAVVMILTYMVGFNMVAAFNIADSLKVYNFYDPATTPWMIGVILAIIFLFCISGSGKKIADITGVLVPVMGVLYIAVALVTLVLNFNMVPGIIANIIKSAFDVQAIFGGFAGSAVMLGIKRGLFSNEAGIGAAACAAGSAGVSHPVKQGLAQSLSVFIDTIIVCTATAMLLLCSGVEPTAETAGMPYIQNALSSSMGTFGVIFITVTLFLFAFTTLLGNYFFAKTGVAYLCGNVPSRAVDWIQRIVAVLVVCIGATMPLNIVWDTADVLMGLMAIVNIPVLIVLLKPVIRCLNDYSRQRKAGKNPVFQSAEIGLETKTDFWNCDLSRK